MGLLHTPPLWACALAGVLAGVCALESERSPPLASPAVRAFAATARAAPCELERAGPAVLRRARGVGERRAQAIADALWLARPRPARSSLPEVPGVGPVTEQAILDSIGNR